MPLMAARRHAAASAGSSAEAAGRWSTAGRRFASPIQDSVPGRSTACNLVAGQARFLNVTGRDLGNAPALSRAMAARVVPLAGIEPAADCLEGSCSIR